MWKLDYRHYFLTFVGLPHESSTTIDTFGESMTISIPSMPIPMATANTSQHLIISLFLIGETTPHHPESAIDCVFKPTIGQIFVVASANCPEDYTPQLRS